MTNPFKSVFNFNRFITSVRNRTESSPRKLAGNSITGRTRVVDGFAVCPSFSCSRLGFIKHISGIIISPQQVIIIGLVAGKPISCLTLIVIYDALRMLNGGKDCSICCRPRLVDRISRLYLGSLTIHIINSTVRNRILTSPLIKCREIRCLGQCSESTVHDSVPDF